MSSHKKVKVKINLKILNELVYQVNGAAMEVHQELGPGLLENVYHQCMKEELNLRGISFKSELIIPVKYKSKLIDTNLRLDLLVEDILPVELKAVEEILPIHQAQLLTYMKLLKLPKGLLINFNVTNLYYKGQKTLVNELYYDLE